jgi:hypothetical protein
MGTDRSSTNLCKGLVSSQAHFKAEMHRYHHTLWLVVNRGIDDNRIEETHPAEDADDIRNKIRDEAEHAAFRITALVRRFTRRLLRS